MPRELAKRLLLLKRRKTGHDSHEFFLNLFSRYRISQSGIGMHLETTNTLHAPDCKKMIHPLPR